MKKSRVTIKPEKRLAMNIWDWVVGLFDLAELSEGIVPHRETSRDFSCAIFLKRVMIEIGSH